MENFTHSLSKKHYAPPNGHFASPKPLYDDVFGAPANFPTLSPRSEDYAEIFGGFNSSRASSIPFLDIPAVDGSDISFDVRSSPFDYSEVFGGFNGFDFAASYEDLFGQSNGQYDAWTPVQSESPSEESDPSACSGTNQGVANGDSDQSCDGTKKFNISYHKANRKGKEDMLSGMTHVTQLHAVPGFTVLLNGTPPLQNAEDKNPPLRVPHDVNLGIEFGGVLIEGKRLRKTMSHLPNSVLSSQSYGNDSPLAGYDKAGPDRDGTFITMCDITLKTRPSVLPPPSRPPPALAVKKGYSDGLNSRFRASKSYDFERMAGDSSPPFFDVEVDAGASAVASAAAMREAMEKAEVKLRCAKESKQRKEGVQKLTKLRSENDIKAKVRKACDTFDGFDNFKEDKLLETYETKRSGMKSIEVEKLVRGAENPAELITGKYYSSSRRSCNTEGFVAWREATQFYGVAETDQFASDQFKDEKILVQNMKSHEYKEEKNAVMAVFRQQEHNSKKKAASEVCEWEKNRNPIRGAKESCESDENKGRSVVAKQSNSQDEHPVKVKVAESVYERKENDKKLRVAKQLGEIRMKRSEADKCEELDDQLTQNGLGAEQKPKGANRKIDIEKKLKNTRERNESGSGIRSKETFEREEDETRLNMTIKQVENERMEETRKLEEKEEQRREAHEGEEIEKKQKENCEREETEKRLKEALEQGEIDKSSDLYLERRENKNQQKLISEREQNERRLRKGFKQEENDNGLNKTLEQDDFAPKRKEAHEREENEKTPNEAREREEREKRLAEAWEQQLQEAYEREASEKRLEIAFKEEGTDKRLRRDIECENRIRVAGVWEGLKGRSKDHDQTEKDETKRKLNSHQQVPVDAGVQNFKSFDEVCELEDNETPQVIEVASEHDINSVKLEATQKAISYEEVENLRTELKDSEREPEAIEEVYVEKSSDVSGMHQDGLQYKGNHLRMENDRVTKSNGNGAGIGIGQTLVESDKRSYRIEDSEREPEAIEEVYVEKSSNLSGMHQDGLQYKGNHLRMENDSVTKSNGAGIGIGIGQTLVESDKRAYRMAAGPENANIVTHQQGETGNDTKVVQFTFDQDGIKDKFTAFQVVREWVENGSKTGDALSAMLEGKGNTQNIARKATSQSTERKERNFNDTLTAEEREKEEMLKRDRELENGRLRKMEEEREREREREKDRMAVDRITREARDRAFAEARERAERAAVERATSEVRQRAITEARERLEKASAEARERSLAEKASMEARLRAERAAEERETAEARECAVERLMAEKASFEERERLERRVVEKLSASSRSGVRQKSSSSDLQFQNMESSNGLRYFYSSVPNGVEGETAQRCKARLERHQRTAERAAKALAEKNMRDLLTQREQTERNRLAETLDAEVKRWSSLKEGNLRALLSTLQYILGADSGWQPIPLTEVITSAAVKKAYRKATLCVHPDKLQQRGASIQQKYICEKVFDLLKEAWNKFNSEER